MYPNVKTVSPIKAPIKALTPAAKSCARDFGRIAERQKPSHMNKMNEIVTNHPGETLNVIRNWLHQGH